MVYVYSKLKDLNKYLKKKMSASQIKQSLIDMGMDVKGEVKKDNDVELKIEVTAERFDLVSTCGIARAINYYNGFSQKLYDFKTYKSKEKVIVNSNLKNVRPYTCAFLISNFDLDNKKLNEIIEIQEKIHESFGRERKKAAIGIYPIEKVKFPIHFESRDKKDINFHPLFSDRVLSFDEIITKNEVGRKYFHLIKHLERYAVFRDSNNEILSLTPIINSFKTGKVETFHKDLFVEVSGHNLELLNKIAIILATTFYDMGAKIKIIDVSYKTKKYNLNLNPTFEEISLNYINKLIGYDFNLKQVKTLLLKSMYELTSYKKTKNDFILKVKVPCYKLDVWSDCDIADDIARAYGYNNLIPNSPVIDSSGKTLEFTKFKNRVREILTQNSFLEIYSYLLSSKEKQFSKMNLNEKNYKFINLKGAVEGGINVCRINVLPEILESLNINRKNSYPQNVFEVGMTIKEDLSKDTRAKNDEKLSVVIADTNSNYTKVKEIFDTINSLFDLDLKLKEKKFNFLIEGRSAKILFKNKEVGFIGEVSPKVLDNFGILVPVGSFEISLREIFETKS